MNETITVINEKPDARKKGLRIVVDAVEVDENGWLKKIRFKYSYLGRNGLCWVEVSDWDKVTLFDR